MTYSRNLKSKRRTNECLPPPPKNSKRPIIIPSCHIYAIEDNKFIDNQVDRIETVVFNPSTAITDEIVFNEHIFDGWYVGETQTDIQVHTSLNFAILKADVVCAYVKLTPTYVTKTISIPKAGKNLSVQKILTGYSRYNSPNVAYSLWGTVIKGTATGVAHTGYSDNKYVDDLQIQETENNKYSHFTILDSDTNVSKTYRQATSSLGHHEVTATVNLDNKSNILTAEATEYADYFEITLTILSGIEKITMGGWNIFDNDQSKDTQIINMSGEYLKYIPTQLDITLNGQVIKLILTEENLVIGGNTRSNAKTTQKVLKNQLVAQFTINFADEQNANAQRSLARTAQPQTTYTVKSNNEYYDDNTYKNTYYYKITQAEPRIIELRKSLKSPISFAEYRTHQKEVEEIVGVKYKRFLEAVHTESVDLTDKYIGNSTQDYKLVETENENSVVAIQFIPTYVKKTIEIPIIRADEEVVDLEIATSAYPEDRDISIRLYGTVNKGMASNTLTYKANEVSFSWEDTEYLQEETSEEDYKYLSTTQDYTLDNGLTIELKLNNEETFKQDKKDFETFTTCRRIDDTALVDITILCGLKVTKLGAKFKPTSKTKKMSGVYEEFIPTTCEITIFGNTVELKL